MGTQMTIQRMEAYVEIIEILKYMDKKYIEKIPSGLLNFFKSNCSKEYNFQINPKIPLKEHNLKDKTLDILAMLNLNYWCETEKHKQELLSLYSENERIYQEELKEKYNPDNIFKNRKDSEEFIEEEQETALANIEPIPLYKRIFNKIKEFFSKHKIN